MNAVERRAEIVRILMARRMDTMGCLAAELGVSTRTIRSDIAALTANYPLETKRGNGGYVRMADWYHPSRDILSEEQQRVIVQLIPTVGGYEARILREMLMEYGSLKYGKQVS